MPLDLFETLESVTQRLPPIAAVSNDGDVLSEYIYNTTHACGEEGNHC